MAASFLLNAGRVRVAPPLTEGTVLRIEPPLIADTAFCDQLIKALKRLLDALRAGRCGELLGHFMGVSRSPRLSEERGPSEHALSRSSSCQNTTRANAHGSPSSCISSGSGTCGVSIPAWSHSVMVNWND